MMVPRVLLGVIAVACEAASVPGPSDEAPPPAPSVNRSVAVVGAGMGGAAVAYYLRQADPTANVTVFESRDYIGGRLKHTVLHNTTIELGGDAWSTAANEYIVALAKKLGPGLIGRRRPHATTHEARCSGESSGCGNCGGAPPAHCTAHCFGGCELCCANAAITASNAVGDPPTLGVGVWDGTVITPIEGIMLTKPADDVKLAEIEARFLAQLRQNYNVRGDAGVFTSIDGFVADGGLEAFTSTTAGSFFNRSGITAEVQRLVLEPLTRVIYDQDLDAMQAFSAVVAVTSLLGAASFDPGNSVLVERMLQAAGAEVLLSTAVTSIQRGGSGRYTVDTNGEAAPRWFDDVVIACPIEFTDITLPATATMPAFRRFEHIFVTVVRAAAINPVYFGSKGRTVPYDNILTSRTAGAPFVVLQLEARLPDGTALWKLFSNSDITAVLPKIFSGLSADPADTVLQRWPYTFPELAPVTNTSAVRYQPIVLDKADDSADTGHIFYVNAMESVASAMEGSIIAGRNIALLLQKA